MNKPFAKLRDDGRNEPEFELDQTLASRFGPYASYVSPNDPTWTDFHGDSPAIEMDRLLNSLVTPETNVLDLGCGAGFTLCRLAKNAESIYGVDLQLDLIEATIKRVAAREVTNSTILSGNTTESKLVDQIPDDHFKSPLAAAVRS